MDVEGNQFCRYCGKLIVRGQAWSVHEFDSGYCMYYHYACNKGNEVELIPLNVEHARSLLNFLKLLESSDIEDWRLESIRVLENVLGE